MSGYNFLNEDRFLKSDKNKLRPVGVFVVRRIEYLDHLESVQPVQIICLFSWENTVVIMPCVNNLLLNMAIRLTPAASL